MSARAANKRRERSLKDRRALEKNRKDTDISDIPMEFPDLAKDAAHCGLTFLTAL